MTVDVGLLPRITLAAGTKIFRIHRAGRDPWYFDASTDGRFNPTHRPDLGACYWAEAPLGAFVEVFRTRLRLTDDDIDGRQLTTVTLSDPLSLVDLTERNALRAGVTASVVHGTDYGPAQRLASDLADAVDGIRWRVRHDLQQSLVGVALFGRPGHKTPSKRLVSSLISPEIQRLANSEFGYEVLPAVNP